MPIFEYHCLDCHTQFERLRSAGERDATTPCPQCASTRAKRTISVFATPRSHVEGRAGAAAAPARQGCACGGNCNCH